MLCRGQPGGTAHILRGESWSTTGTLPFSTTPRSRLPQPQQRWRGWTRAEPIVAAHLARLRKAAVEGIAAQIEIEDVKAAEAADAAKLLTAS